MGLGCVIRQRVNRLEKDLSSKVACWWQVGELIGKASLEEDEDDESGSRRLER